MFTVIPLPRTFAHILPDIVLSTPTQTLVILSARVIGDAGCFCFFFATVEGVLGPRGRLYYALNLHWPAAHKSRSRHARLRVRVRLLTRPQSSNSRHYTGEGTRDSVSFVFFFFLQFRLPPLYDENFISSMGFYSLLVSARF